MAVACRDSNKTSYCSYEFINGFQETQIAEKIAKYLDVPFQKYIIKEGSLWETLDELSSINQCYTEFTHARPFSVIDKMEPLGDLFLLGHWGDVLFDNAKLPETLSFDELVYILIKKMVKPGGLELANALWEFWDLSGTFNNYLYDSFSKYLKQINIDDPNAKFRAFKSLHWAPRWANSNLGTFTTRKPAFEPYETDEMCKFICTIPENILTERKIQIKYIVRNSPGLAKIMWQDQQPFNLTNYHFNKTPWNLPFRLLNKSKSYFNNKIIRRNWEIQFLGPDNTKKIQNQLFNNKRFNDLVPSYIINEFYENFKFNNVKFSHPISMLITLAQFSKQRTNYKL